MNTAYGRRGAGIPRVSSHVQSSDGEGRGRGGPAERGRWMPCIDNRVASSNSKVHFFLTPKSRLNAGGWLLNKGKLKRESAFSYCLNADGKKSRSVHAKPLVGSALAYHRSRLNFPIFHRCQSPVRTLAISCSKKVARSSSMTSSPNLQNNIVLTLSGCVRLMVNLGVYS